MVPILVVDDSWNDRQAAQREILFSRVVNPVYLFSSAAECLDYFNGAGRFPEPRLPCITIVDLVMAPKNGVELMKELGTLPSSKGSVMIMLSGVADYKMVGDGYAAGATTFLVKPVSSAELVRTFTSNPRLAVKNQPGGIEVSIKGVESGAIPGDSSPLPSGARV